MIPLRRIASFACLAVLLSACASGDDPRADEGPSSSVAHMPRRPLPNIFISPAGEPFRAATGAPYPVASWFAAADRNGDGKLTPDEFRANGLAFFDRLDTNHDGVLDGFEVQNYEQSMAPEILPSIDDLHAMEGMDPNLSFGDPNNTDNQAQNVHPRSSAGRPYSEPTGIGVQGAAVFSVINTPEPVTAADETFDGRITRAEFADTLNHRFATLDKLNKGYLTLAGLPKTPIQTEILKREAARRAREKKEGRRPPPNS